LKPYEILSTGEGCGIIEFLTDTLSIDYIKRKIYRRGATDLLHYFLMNFGNEHTDKFIKARKNFCDSLSGYSLVCYIMQIKDRHNANILLDKDGHVCHIDFGFLLTNAPGKGL
jgi:phosphatidylinositol 4-kinase B